MRSDTVERIDGLSSRVRDHSRVKLYRITHKHVGSQYGGWLCRVEVLRDKTGSAAQLKEFNRMLRRVIKAD